MKKNTKKVRMIRQGDVLVMEAPTAPKAAEELPREAGRVVLAHGEVTGHAHAISDDAVRMFALSGTQDNLLKVDVKALLRHEEHGEIAIFPGNHIVRRQQEYRWGRANRVAD